MERHDCTGSGSRILRSDRTDRRLWYRVHAEADLHFFVIRSTKPYIEGGGGPLWTNFDGRIREQGSDFNFLVWGGAGVSYDLTSHWAINAGVRFSHISNSGLDTPNSGLNYLLPFAGVSTKLF